VLAHLEDDDEIPFGVRVWLADDRPGSTDMPQTGFARTIDPAELQQHLWLVGDRSACRPFFSDARHYYLSIVY
jgi:hypothetical protein